MGGLGTTEIFILLFVCGGPVLAAIVIGMLVTKNKRNGGSQ